MAVSTDQETLSHLSLEALQKQLSTSNQGLGKKEALQRRSQGGYNELPETTVSPLMQFLSHFWGPIAWMIEAAVILSALVGDWVNFGIILLLLIGNGVVGFWEEFQTGNAIAALKAKLALQARVKRDNTWMEIPARELVPGDVIRLRLGDWQKRKRSLVGWRPPIGWGLAGFVWIYALIWFLIADWVKQRAYGVFNHDQPVYVTRGLKKLTRWLAHPRFRQPNKGS